MGSPVTIFSGTTGLNTVVDPVRLSFDTQTGVSELATATNITVDQTGRPGRRTGYTKKQDGVFHSLFCDGGDCLVIKDGANDAAIYQVATDMSLTGVRSGMIKAARVAFAQVIDRTYYCNGYEKGFVEGGISNPWVKTEYVGPETTRSFSEVPVGHHLAFAFARIFVAQAKVVYWTEPFQYGLFDMARSYWRFKTNVRMIKPVASGLFISDEKDTWFYRGTNPFEAVPVKVASYPAAEWSEAIEYVEGMEAGIQEPGLCALWASREGACLGTASGSFINLNKDKIIYPDTVQQGVGLIRGYNFIHGVL